MTAAKYSPVVRNLVASEPAGTRSAPSPPGPHLFPIPAADPPLNWEVAVSVLNLVPRGVIVTDEGCRILFLNRAAERILFEHDGLSFQHNLVVASFSEEARALKKLVSDAVRSALIGGVSRWATITISRPSLQRPHEIVVVGLKVKGLLHPPTATVAAMLIGQQDVEAPTVEHMIADLYDLTAAESRLATMLMRGTNLTQVASDLGITRETARTHLKNIFAKTGTNRQSELVRLLVAGPANLYLRHENSPR